MEILIEKINSFLEKYYRFILAAIFVLLLCLNIFVYYKYVFLAGGAEINNATKGVSVNEEVLNSVLGEIDIREKTLIRIETSEYFDPFN